MEDEINTGLPETPEQVVPKYSSGQNLWTSGFSVSTENLGVLDSPTAPISNISIRKGGLADNIQSILDSNEKYWAGNQSIDPTAEALYVEKLTMNPLNIIMLSGGGGTQPIQGFLDASMTFGAQATWDNNIVGSGPLDATAAGLNSASQIGGLSTIRMARSSLVTWQSSTFNALNFSVFILATDSKNPLVEADKVWDYVLPSRGGPGIMVTPGGYSASVFSSKGSGQDGTVSVFVGNWFAARDAWVCSSAQIEVSKQRVKGTASVPLWVKIDMVMNPSREFYADEVQDFFIKY